MATDSTSHVAPATDIVVPSVPTPRLFVPRLESGDRLTRAEFERRYAAMSDVKKAELIDGVVFMPSPVRASQHGIPDSRLSGWLFTYSARTPGLLTSTNSTVRLDLDNEFQPDSLLMIAAGGQATIDADGYITGPPELVAEVASSSVSIDLNAKLNVYRRNGVREYIVWRVLDEAIDWFALRDGQFVPLPVADDGIIRSEVFPGLWLNAPAMLQARLDAVMATLEQGLATPEHATFAASIVTPSALGSAGG
jgi:Uma2 family endonuclease